MQPHATRAGRRARAAPTTPPGRPPGAQRSSPLLPWLPLLPLWIALAFAAPRSAEAGPAAAPAAERLRVVATIPDLADIARAIGGDAVEVKALARGTENAHNVLIRPSTINATARADLFLQVGLALEHAWVPGLLMTSRNARIQPGAPGFVNCSIGFDPIQVPPTMSRQQAAEIHPFGNPHMNLDPSAGELFADHIEAAFATARPEREQYFAERSKAYRARLSAARERWTRLAEGLAGRTVVLYHNEHDYLLRSLGIDVAAVLEVRPGVPPTPRHLADVCAIIAEREVPVILTSLWSNNSAVRHVAEETGARVVEIPTMVGGRDDVTSWIGLMDSAHRELRVGFGLPAEPRPAETPRPAGAPAKERADAERTRSSDS